MCEQVYKQRAETHAVTTQHGLIRPQPTHTHRERTGGESRLVGLVPTNVRLKWPPVGSDIQLAFSPLLAVIGLLSQD